MKKTLSLNEFTILMIATLADNSKIIDWENRDKRIAVLPVDYKQRIENILCSENGFKEKFSILIDIDEYFQDHFAWEEKLAIQIKNFLQRMGKDFEYDFVMDSLNISFTQKEIGLILSNYRNNNIKKIMRHFTSVMSDNIYTREFQEHFYDYNSRSVLYMKRLIRDEKI